ncbi:MAG TPA: formylglycine-generating enzyme family protein [Terriglobia bacterium]|jgi:formylglycine-generating enzyme required for sulfatase activity
MKRILIAALTFGACGLLAQNQIIQQKSAELKNDAGIEFVQIQPGQFMMGCSVGDIDCNADERPIHQVQLSKPYQIGKYELTQAQWQSVMGSNPSTIKGDDRPVETVSKDEAHEFLNRLNARNDGYHYRLPTEAEWEYAARAGSATPYAGKLDEIGWYNGNSDDETHPVGQKKPNPWGLYDMEGNVREWVEDMYSANYYKTSPAVDPTGPAGGGGGRGGRGGRRGGRGFGGRRGNFGGPPPGGPPTDGTPSPNGPPPNGARGFGGGRAGRGGPDGQRGGGLVRGLPVIRGGAWDNPATYLRVSARYSYYGSTLRVSDLGFRVVREPEVKQ